MGGGWLASSSRIDGRRLIIETFSGRNIGLDLVRATEAAALAAGQWVGRGDAAVADGDAARALRRVLNSMHIDGTIIVGEEGRHPDESELLVTGEKVGDGTMPAVDIVVDPVEGIRLLAEGLPETISVAGIAPKGTMRSLAPAPYMEKLVVSREAADAIKPRCLDAPVGWTLGLVAEAKQKPVRALTVFVLNRPRHDDLISEIRESGARILLRPDGDVAGALMAATPGSGVDVLMGVGGTPEGVIAACAVRALGGAMFGRIAPEGIGKGQKMLENGRSLDEVFSANELVTSDDLFFAATGITEGSMLDGVKFLSSGMTTHSMVLRGKTGTRRTVRAEHHRDWMKSIVQDHDT